MRGIHSAAERGNYELIKEIITADPSKVHELNDLGDQPLHTAAYQGRKKVAELLLNAGADVNFRGHNGRTPLLIALLEDRSTLMKEFLERGANPDIPDNSRATPLYWAAVRRDKKTVKLLLNHGASTDILANLFLEGPDRTLEELKTDPSILSSIDRPEDLLQGALETGSEPLVRFLLDNGVNPNVIGRQDAPALFLAIETRDPAIVRMLLEHGADVHVKSLGSGPIKTARILKCPEEIIHILSEYGASDE